MKLVIISHTGHFYDLDGKIRGWGPTIREINFLATKFEEIVHVGVLHEGSPPESSLPYTSSNIRFAAMPPSGGKSLTEKLKSLSIASKIISIVKKEIKSADIIQLRIPTGIANYLLPYLAINKNSYKKIWVKYAGNWMQKNAPAGYRFQRWWLRKNFLNCNVTINGKWPGQPQNCLTFENPCLDELERDSGKRVISDKKYHPPYTACFIGRIENEKGIQRILESLDIFKSKNISTIHFIGEGPAQTALENKISFEENVRLVNHGSVDRSKIPDILAQSHFLLLPSTASEGFPKVIAEGMNYGAVPIVSDVSSINQYINDQNGFVWPTGEVFKNWLQQLNFRPEDLKSKSVKGYEVAGLFTFENYFKKLEELILNDH